MTIHAAVYDGGTSRDVPEVPAIFQNSRMIGVAIVNQSGTVCSANSLFMSWFGSRYDAFSGGIPIEDIFVDANAWNPPQSKYDSQVSSVVAQRDDGEKISLKREILPVTSDGNCDYFYCIFTVDDAALMQNLMEHSTHMEAVAGLSTGIAHDFNNLLTVLVGNLYLVGEEMRAEPEVFNKIKSARDTAVRGADLTRQLLDFARAGESANQLFKPAGLVERLAPLLGRLVGKKIRLTTSITDYNDQITAAPSQLENAIVNLVINAKDAIGGTDGEVCLSVTSEQIDSVEAASLEISEGFYVVIEVADNGPGISAEIAARVFDPFFTTKSSGKGTGLGLSMVRWFAENNKGTVILEPGKPLGSNIRILLPRESVSNTDETCSKTMPLSVLPNGSEAVLVVIEDAEICAMTRQCLAVLGYEVTSLATMEDARRISLGRFDLAIIEAPVIDESSSPQDLYGFSNAGCRLLVVSSAGNEDFDEYAVLQKPFSLVELALGVRAALDGATDDDK